MIVWRCQDCGGLDVPQECIDVCIWGRADWVDADSYESERSQVAVDREVEQSLAGLLRRFAFATPRDLIPGMIAGGVGVGLVNPPLASTAVGVVPPQRAGMASGINSTFRQVGIATGIALLGTLFSNNVKDEVLARVAAVPGLSRSGPQIAAAVQSGEIRNVIARLPAQARPAAGMITRAAFTTGLNRILLVAAVIAVVSGVISLAAIRGRDFAQQQRPGPPG